MVLGSKLIPKALGLGFLVDEQKGREHRMMQANHPQHVMSRRRRGQRPGIDFPAPNKWLGGNPNGRPETCLRCGFIPPSCLCREHERERRYLEMEMIRRGGIGGCRGYRGHGHLGGRCHGHGGIYRHGRYLDNFDEEYDDDDSDEDDWESGFESGFEEGLEAGYGPYLMHHHRHDRRGHGPHNYGPRRHRGPQPRSLGAVADSQWW